MRPRNTSSASLVIVLVAAVAIAACHGDNPSAPYRPLSVRLTVTRNGPYVSTDSTGSPLISCEYQLAAVATGSDQAVWTGGVFRWNVGAQRVPIDSQVMSAAEMRDFWGSDTVPNGTQREVGVGISASVPFGAEVVMRFRNVETGAVGGATAELSCIPPVVPDTTPLAITGLKVTPDIVQPGDMIDMAFTATAGAGLWQTLVVLSTASDTIRQVFYETAAKTVHRDVVARIPTRSALGEVVRVDVYASDLMLKTVSASLTIGPLVDSTPPTLTAGVLDYPYSRGPTPLQGQYAEGDTIHLAVTARDNQRLRWIVYSLGAPANVRDSIAMVDTAVTDFHINIPVQPGWAGSPTLTIYARDLSGLPSTPVVTAPGVLHVYPLVTHPVRSGSFDGDITDVALDEPRQLMYVAQAPQQRVAIVSMQTLTAVAYVAMPSRPSGLDISVGGDSLVVALTDARALAVVDLTAPDYPLALIPVTAADTTQNAGKPLGIRIAANGKALVPLNGGMHWMQAQTLEVDFPAGTQRVRSDLPLMEGDAVSRSGDRSALVLSGNLWSGNTGGSCGYRYLAASDAFGPCHGAAYGQLGTTTTGNAWTNGAMLMAADLSNLRLLYVNNITYFGVALSPDGEYAYLTSRGWVTVERASDGVVLERAQLGPTGRPLVTADGSTLFGFTAGDGTVHVAAMTLR